MKNLFKKTSAATLSEAEQDERSPAEKALMEWGIKYKKQPDGSVLVPGDLNISNNGLTELPDLSSVAVGGDFFCHNNQLTSLEGAPRTVGGDFFCNNNQLTSLEHAPHTVTGFYCYNSQLTSLEHAPQTFMKLRSDFGEYSNWEQVPEQLRISPETKVRLEQEQIAAATVLQAPVKVGAPLKLRNRAPA